MSDPWGRPPSEGDPPPGSYPGAHPGYGFAPPVPKPSNNLALAILTTLLCCMPLGVVAIVYAAQVDSKWNAGDYQGAMTAADNAKKAAIAGIILGFVVIVLYVLLVGASGMSTSGY